MLAITFFETSLTELQIDEQRMELLHSIASIIISEIHKNGNFVDIYNSKGINLHRFGALFLLIILIYTKKTRWYGSNVFFYKYN